MHSKLLSHQARWIAGSLLSLAITASLALGAESSGIRISAPTLGWVLSPDGSQVVEITGVPESPRTGRALPLASAGRRLWPAPDASAAIVQTDTALLLLRANEQLEPLAELPAATMVTAAWDRASAGFALCWDTNCEARAASGSSLGRFEVPAGSRAIAFSSTAGLLTATSDSAQWLRGAETIVLDVVPAAAAFRPGTRELWLLDDAGQLSSLDGPTRQTTDISLVPNAVGLLASLDGAALFAANAEGAAAITNLSTRQTTPMNIEDSVEGVWAAPGAFTARLHESAKRAIAIWNGESNITGWVPAAASEVRQ